MSRLAAVLSPLAIALALAVAGPAMAQGGNPFGPLTPQTPPPQPPPPPAPEPVSQPDDGELSARESLGLAAIAALLIGGVFVAIVREGGRLGRGQRRRRKHERERRAKATEPRKRGAAAFRSSTPAAAKAPPPPPRKRRAKAKRK